MNDKEYNVSDVVYMLYNNTPVKCIITSKLYLREQSVEIFDRATHNILKTNPSDILKFIKNDYKILYKLAIIPHDTAIIEYQAINGAYFDYVLFDSMDDLLTALSKTPV